MVAVAPSHRPVKIAAMNDASTTVRGTALLTKALDIVELISDSDNRLKFKDIAERTGHSKSTLYRILSALTAHGMIDIDRRDQSYVLGPKFTRMAGSINSSSDLIAVSASPLKAIADLHGETVNLAIMSGTAHITISRWQGRLAQAFSSPLGERKPLHATSLGKALMAFLPKAERQRLIAQLRLQPYTPHTLTEAQALENDLELCRARGFALDDNEIIEGVTCVAVPVLDPEGAVIAAVSITAPSHRMGLTRRLELASVLQVAVRQITAQLAPPRRAAIEPVASTRARLAMTDLRAFSPRVAGWSKAFGGLVWHDGPAGLVAIQLEAEHHPLAQFGQVTAVALQAGGDLVIVADGRLWELTPDMAEPQSFGVLTNVTAAGLAELPDGDLLLLQNGALSRLSPESGETVVLAKGFEDGPGFDLFDGHVHLVAKGGQQALSFELARGTLTSLDLPVQGALGGLAADGAGGFWLALRLAWSLCHVNAAGLATHLPIPVPGAQGLVRGRRPGELHAGSDRMSLSQNMLDIAPMAGALLHVSLPDAGQATR